MIPYALIIIAVVLWFVGGHAQACFFLALGAWAFEFVGGITQCASNKKRGGKA